MAYEDLDVALGSVSIGSLIVATAAGDMGVLQGSSGVDGNVLTLQADGTAAWEAPASTVTAFDDLSDVTLTTVARGDMLLRGATDWNNLAVGTSGQVIRSDGTDPSWSAIQAGDLPSHTHAETEITDGSLLARVADAETISGAWTVSGNWNFTGEVDFQGIVDLAGNNHYYADHEDYGANQTDVEIQAAIDAANTAGGGTVHVTPGTWTISTTVTIKSNVVLHVHEGATIQADAALAGPLLTNANLTTGDSNFAIIGRGTFDALGDSRTGTPGANPEDKFHCIFLSECSDFLVRDILVTNTWNIGLALRGESTSVRNCVRFHVERVRATVCSDTGITLDFCSNGKVTDPLCYNNGGLTDANAIGFGKGFWINQSSFIGCTGYVGLDNGLSATATAADDISLISSQYCVISDFTCDNPARYGVRVGFLDQSADDCVHNVIGNGTIQSSGDDGLRIESDPNDPTTATVTTRNNYHDINILSAGNRSVSILQSDNSLMHNVFGHNSTDSGWLLNGGQAWVLTGCRFTAATNNHSVELINGGTGTRAWANVRIEGCWLTDQGTGNAVEITNGTGTVFVTGGNVATINDTGGSATIKHNVGWINDLSTAAAVDGASDFIAIYDASLGTQVKLLINNLPGGGGGEANTASNSGTDGVGVFDQKVGTDLEFRHIASVDSALTVTLDATDDDIDLDPAGLVRLEGRSGGQTIQGSTDASEHLTLESTTDVTKGEVRSLDALAIRGGNDLIFYDDDNSASITLAIGAAVTSRTHTIPDVASDTFAMVAATQTLTNKTLTTPTIGDFQNATHNHQDAAGGGQLDHGAALTGLTDDDHTQYALLAGRSGGQTLQGSTDASEHLTLESTANATKGEVRSLDDLAIRGGNNLLFYDDDNSAAITLVIGAAVTARTHTIPDVANDTFAMVAATQTLTNKTLTTPTIGDFTNATHDHSNAAGGGTLAQTAIATLTRQSTILLPITGAILDATNPPVEAGSGRTTHLAFDDTTDEIIYFVFRLPDDYSSGGTFICQYSMASATTAEVVISVEVMAVTDGDAQDLDSDSYDTINTSSATTVPATAGHPDEISLTLSNMDSAAAGDYIALRCRRDADNAGDDATGDMEWRSCALTYTAALDGTA